LREGHKIKTLFWGIDFHLKDCFISMEVFAIWFEKCPYKFSKSVGLGVGKLQLCQMLH
jgi:hypothetical protein